jgi:hypothetical protein
VCDNHLIVALPDNLVAIDNNCSKAATSLLQDACFLAQLYRSLHELIVAWCRHAGAANVLMLIAVRNRRFRLSKAHRKEWLDREMCLRLQV